MYACVCKCTFACSCTVVDIWSSEENTYNVDSGTNLKSLDLVRGNTISLTPQIVLKLPFSLWGGDGDGGGMCELCIWKARKALSMLGKQCTTNL